MEAKHGMCGNGIRCLAKYLYEQGFITEKNFVIETLSGEKQIELIVENKTVIGIDTKTAPAQNDVNHSYLFLSVKNVYKPTATLKPDGSWCAIVAAKMKSPQGPINAVKIV